MYTLLVVDDNNRERTGVSQLALWRELGFEKILTAPNGKIGYETALAQQPFLVVADVSMPIMDGLTMAKKIREHYPDTKFVFISCFDDSQYVREAFDVDAFGYILKPINFEKLKNVVEKILKIDIIRKEKDGIVKKLESQIAENRQVIKEQITRDLLYGNLVDFGAAKAADMEIKAYAIAAVMRIDRFERLISDEKNDSIYMYVYGIRQFIDESKPDNIRISVFIRGRDSIGILALADDAENEQDALGKCLDCFNIIKSGINESFDIEVSVFLGGVTKEIEKLHTLFRNAEYAMDNSVSSKNNSIILADRIQDSGFEQKYDISNLKQEIMKIVESGDLNAVNDFVNRHYSEGEVHTQKSIKSFTIFVMTTLNLVLSEMDESFVSVFDNEFSVWEKLNNYNSILDIRQWVTNILKFTAEYISEKKADRYTKMVEDIKSIIDSQYAEIENINQVSAQIYMSTVHANSVFKRETGQTIFDYLTKVRMEKAKQMLKEKNSKVYLVSEMVGYKSKTYFASLFREYTGMAPSEYRDKF